METQRLLKPDASPLQVRPARLSDVHVLASLTLQSFRSVSYWDWMHVTPSSSTSEQQKRRDDEVYRDRVSIVKRQLCNPDLQTYLATYNGQPAAFSMWSVQRGTANRNRLSHRLRRLTTYERVLQVWYKVIDYIVSWMPDWLQTAIWYPTLGPQYLARRKLMQQQREGTAGRYLTGGPDIEQGYRLLIFLATSPEFERKGIGSKLLKQGLQEAEEDAVPVYLGATPAGRPLYERNGFKLMGTDSKGEPGVCTWEEAVMRWQPSEKVGVA